MTCPKCNQKASLKIEETEPTDYGPVAFAVICSECDTALYFFNDESSAMAIGNLCNVFEEIKYELSGIASAIEKAGDAAIGSPGR